MMLDSILKNGVIYTLSKERETFQAAGIKDGKIAFLGSDKEAEKMQAETVFDLKGRAVIPGMGDSHLHFYAYCQTLFQVDLGDCTSKKEALQKLKDAVDQMPEGQWIRGANFDQTKWRDSEDELPTRHDLDEVSTKHPIVIKRVCLHTAVANTKALEIAGIDENYVNEPGGIVEREENGMPNGILREQLTKIFDDRIPDPLEDMEVRKKVMAEQLQRMASMGLTMMHTYAAEIWKYMEDVETYRELDSEGKLPLRVSVYTDKLETMENLKKSGELSIEEKSDPRHKAQMSGYKLFCDGCLGARSAALFEDYSDEPGNRGIVVEPENILEEKMYRAMSQGIQCATHAIGDRALDMVVTAIEKTIAKLEKDGMSRQEIEKKPFRIIHAQMSTENLVERMKKLPLIIDVQPAFISTDKIWIKDRIGEKRLQTSYPWKTYTENGMILTGGSDAPVESFNPMWGIYNCLTHPDEKQRLSRYEALCLFSRNIPYATGDETFYGTLEIGKFADMAVLEKDIFCAEVEEIKDIKVMQTFLGGKQTWSCL